MKRSLLFVCLAGLLALSRSGFSQPVVDFLVAPGNAACGDTISVEPGATIEIPLELSLNSDSDVSGFTMSLRVKPDPAIVVEPSDLNGQRTMQFVDLTRVTAAGYSALHFPEPCCANVGEPPVRGDIPVVLQGQEVKDNFPVPANPDLTPTEGPLTGSPQGPGYTLGIVYNIGNNPIVGPFAIVLPPGEGIVVENNIFIRVTAPDTEGQFPIEFVFEDGLVGGGSPVGNIATINQMSVTPTRGSCTLTLSTAGVPRGVIPGDTNGSGDLTAMDALDLLDHYFRGTVDLPCGDTVFSPGNLALLDGNGDAEVDLSDAVWTLRAVFLGGAPHVLGTDCTVIEGCDNTTCDL